MTTSTNHLVQLHYASLDLLNNKVFSTQIFDWLSSEERTRYKRFVNKQQANQYLLARALLRSQLSKRVPGVLPQKWVFVIDDSGKPRLADGFSHLNLRFNLSHSEDLVVLALGDGLGGRLNLGVDVECIHRPVFSMALAKRYFAKTELADLMSLTEPLRIKRIVQLWTLKESYLKACGLGLRIPLANVEFFFEGECGLDFSTSSSWAEPLPAEDRSFISLFSLGPDYSLALTIEADKPIDASVMTVNEWTESNNPLLGLPCELLRKTVGQKINHTSL
jgi:4'-phosphopantetheinyl transferase